MQLVPVAGVFLTDFLRVPTLCCLCQSAQCPGDETSRPILEQASYLASLLARRVPINIDRVSHFGVFPRVDLCACLCAVTNKKWIGENEWMRRPKVQVAVTVQSEAIVAQCMDLMTR